MSYVYMKVLESSPARYERGMQLLTLGRWNRLLDEIARRISAGEQVLDAGCGTGALAVRMAQRGAAVTAVDVSAAMLAEAADRVDEAGVGERVTLREMGVAELDAFPGGAFDAVTSTLLFSELGEQERTYVLAEFGRLLRQGGRLLVADEVLPDTAAGRLATWLLRLPFAIAAYLLTQTTTHRIAALGARIASAGFQVIDEKRYLAGTLWLFVAEKPGGEVGRDV